VTTGVSGECDPRLGGVQDAFVRNFDERGELGAAVAVWLNGRLVVDLWGGFADPVEQRGSSVLGRKRATYAPSSSVQTSPRGGGSASAAGCSSGSPEQPARRTKGQAPAAATVLR
jgi:hypothetical protein